VTEYRLVSDPRAGLDIESAFQWYEKEQSGLGLQFLDELRAAYNRIVENPFKYRHLRSGVRRALLKRFPYVVYFAVEASVSSCSPFFMPAATLRNGSVG
jgi:plasmid stabilization system protein ParE